MCPRLSIHGDKTLELSCRHRYTLRLYRKKPASIDSLFAKPEPNTLFLADTIDSLGEVHAVVLLTTITMNNIVFVVAIINEPLAKRPFRSTSTLYLNFNPRNINYMPAAKIFACLDFERKASFCKRLIQL